MESKRCTGCGLTKPTSEFYRTSRDGLMARCKLCWCEEMRVRRLARVYGITEAELLTMLVLQDSRCAICEEDFPKYRDVQIDHSHETGEVRGLLCRKCNTGLHYFDNADLKLKMESYLAA